jgi:nucleolar protein 14
VRFKYEKKHEREKTLDMTDKLDSEWKQMSFLMSGMFNNKSAQTNDEPVEKLAVKRDENDYDTLVRTLQFDLKAKPTEKLKTAEQLEAERQEALRDAELELMQRMKTPLDDDEAKKIAIGKDKQVLYRSPDDMDFDDFYPELKKNANVNQNEVGKAADEDNDIESDKSDEQSGSDDDDSEEEEGESESDDKANDKADPKTSILKAISNDWTIEFDLKHNKLNKNQLSSDNFKTYLNDLIKQLNPGLDEKNKQRLQLLCTHLIQIYREQAASATVNLSMLEFLSRTLFSICKNNLKEKSIQVFIDLVISLNKDFSCLVKSKRYMPRLDTVFERSFPV